MRSNFSKVKRNFKNNFKKVYPRGGKIGKKPENSRFLSIIFFCFFLWILLFGPKSDSGFAKKPILNRFILPRLPTKSATIRITNRQKCHFCVFNAGFFVISFVL